MSKSKRKRPQQGGRTTPKGGATAKIDAPRPNTGPRDFTAALNEHLAAEGRPFTIGDHTFTAAGTLPAAAVELMVEWSTQTAILGAMQSTVAFIAACLPPDDRERFAAWVEDPDEMVPFKTLDDIAKWLLEGYTGRPTR